MNVVAAEIVPLTGGALFCLYALHYGHWKENIESSNEDDRPIEIPFLAASLINSLDPKNRSLQAFCQLNLLTCLSLPLQHLFLLLMSYTMCCLQIPSSCCSNIDSYIVRFFLH